MNVLQVNPKGDKGAALMTMEDGTNVWTPDIEKAKALIGKPIPADWQQKQGDYGPQAFPPREGKKGAMPPAYRNTKEGQAFEQQQMNRRTALMQAVALDVAGRVIPPETPVWVLADQMYHWLTQASPAQASPPATKAAGQEPSGSGGPGASVPPVSPARAAAGDTSAGAAMGESPAEREQDLSRGEVAGPAPSGCVHPEANRKKTATGAIRCGVCAQIVEAA